MAEVLGFGTNGYRNYENGEVPSHSNGKLIHPNKFLKMVNLTETLSHKETPQHISLILLNLSLLPKD